MGTTKKADRLRIARLHQHNVMGCEDITLDLGDVTVLAGENAAGKSGILRGIRAWLGIDRTSLVRIQRLDDDGAPAEGGPPTIEGLLVDEDGAPRLEIRRTGDGSPEVMEHVGGTVTQWRRPVERLRDLIDVSAANPALMLAASDEDFATMVLEALPLPQYSRAKALEMAGLEAFPLPRIPAGLHALEDLQMIEDAVFGSRTEINRQRDREHDAATQLMAGLPAQAPDDVAADLAELEAEDRDLSARGSSARAEADSARSAVVREADSALVLTQERVSGAFRVEAAKRRSAHESLAAQIRAEAEARISAALAATNEAIEQFKADGEAEIADAETARNLAVDAADRAHQEAMIALDEMRAKVASVRERLAALRAQSEAIATDRHVRAQAEAGEARAAEWAAKSDALTAALKALKAYKGYLAASLPIKGLSVTIDDKARKIVTIDGVPRSMVNDGRLAEIVTEIALLRQRPPEDGRPYLPLVLLDGIERVDPARRKALLRAVAEQKVQVIAACVTDGAFRCLTGDDAIVAAGPGDGGVNPRWFVPEEDEIRD